ncbi:unnamed protein product, partial [Onchocerca ochengi]
RSSANEKKQKIAEIRAQRRTAKLKDAWLRVDRSCRFA